MVIKLCVLDPKSHWPKLKCCVPRTLRDLSPQFCLHQQDSEASSCLRKAVGETPARLRRPTSNWAFTLSLKYYFHGAASTLSSLCTRQWYEWQAASSGTSRPECWQQDADLQKAGMVKSRVCLDKAKKVCKRQHVLSHQPTEKKMLWRNLGRAHNRLFQVSHLCEQLTASGAQMTVPPTLKHCTGIETLCSGLVRPPMNIN